ncbi:MAG: carbohydrate kinase [Bacillota bacterium]|nr:carbohydrate kinase [Bacillota bacterium]
MKPAHRSDPETCFDLVALGELLIDFTPLPTAGGEALPRTFIAHAGGAPANLACQAARLGRRCAYVGAIGNDALGHRIVATLAAHDIDVSLVAVIPDAPTTLAFVDLKPDGERDFSFVRNPGADTRLVMHSGLEALLARARCLHHGALSLTHEPAFATTTAAVRQVREQGGLVSYDPNVRLPLWPDVGLLRSRSLGALAGCDLVKLSDDDLAVLEPEEGREALGAWFERYPLRLILLTSGRAGAEAIWRRADGRVERTGVAASDPGRPSVDSTGAGDSFTGAFLSALFERLPSAAPTESRANFAAWIDWVDHEEMRKLLRYAAQIAAISTTRSGGISSLGDEAERRRIFPSEKR